MKMYGLVESKLHSFLNWTMSGQLHAPGNVRVLLLEQEIGWAPKVANVMQESDVVTSLN